MTQIKYDTNTLSSLIESIEGRITCLLEEEMKEKIENQQLLNRIKTLEQKNQSKQQIKNQLSEQHRLNLRYFDEKISNHEETLQKFKNLYESLHGKRSLNFNSSFLKNNSSFSTQKNSNGFLKGKKDQSTLQQSVITTRSMANCDQQRLQCSKINESINVVCQKECQSCGDTFKPYSYYQHLQHCHREIIPAQMCTSMLID